MLIPYTKEEGLCREVKDMAKVAYPVKDRVKVINLLYNIL